MVRVRLVSSRKSSVDTQVVYQ